MDVHTRREYKAKEKTAGNLTQVLREMLRENKRSAGKTAAGPKICSEGGVLRGQKKMLRLHCSCSESSSKYSKSSAVGSVSSFQAPGSEHTSSELSESNSASGVGCPVTYT